MSKSDEIEKVHKAARRELSFNVDKIFKKKNI